jgi:hypothetical protein
MHHLFGANFVIDITFIAPVLCMASRNQHHLSALGGILNILLDALSEVSRLLRV